MRKKKPIRNNELPKKINKIFINLKIILDISSYI